MPSPKVDSIRCVEREIYDAFEFLKSVPEDEICVPPKDHRRCAFLAKRGKESDGAIEFACRNPRRPPFTILTENCEMYRNLSTEQVKDYYAGKLEKKPEIVSDDKDQCRRLFVKLFGGAEFTEKVRAEFCGKNDCTPPPSLME